MASRIASKCIKNGVGVDTKISTFVRGLIPQNDWAAYTVSSSFPKELDERTGEPKYDSNIFLFSGQKYSFEKK